MNQRRKPERSKSSPETLLQASKKFGRYKEEAEKQTKKQNLTEDKVVQQLKQAFTRFLNEKVGTLALLKNIDYSSADITKFSISLTEFQKHNEFSEKAAKFLNSMIKWAKEDEFIIHTTDLDMPIFNLCRGNTKNITIIGDVSDGFADGMKKGKITVKGNACGPIAADMKNGEIVIEGNAQAVGFKMRGGMITIEGSTHGYVGDRMKGGLIIVQGDAYDFSSHVEGGEVNIEGTIMLRDDKTPLQLECCGMLTAPGGSIYNKGELICGKGKTLV